MDDVRGMTEDELNAIRRHAEIAGPMMSPLSAGNMSALIDEVDRLKAENAALQGRLDSLYQQIKSPDQSHTSLADSLDRAIKEVGMK